MSVTVKPFDWCVHSIIAVVDFILVGVENILSEDLITISPNPNDGKFNIEIDDLNVKSVEIFDLQGRLLYQKINVEKQPIISIHLKYANSGMYLIKVKMAINTHVGIGIKKVLAYIQETTFCQVKTLVAN